MKTTTERQEQEFCGVTIFTWEEWDDVGTGILQFYNVEFPFESMKKYNGTMAVFSLSGQLTLFDENDNEIIDIWVTDIPELKEILLKKEKKWNYVETDGNPKEPGLYWTTLIHPEWKDGKKTGKEIAETATRYFANLDTDPDMKDWTMDGEPSTGLAWTEETGSAMHEKVYAWMPMENVGIDIAKLPDGVEAED